MLTFLEISATFREDWRLRLALCQCTQSCQLVNSNTNAYHSSRDSLFQILLSIKTNLLEYLTTCKTLMIFHNDAPNSPAPAFLEFFVNALSIPSHSISEIVYRGVIRSECNFPERLNLVCVRPFQNINSKFFISVSQQQLPKNG